MCYEYDRSYLNRTSSPPVRVFGVPLINWTGRYTPMNKVELGEEERIRASEARTTTWLRIALAAAILRLGA